MKKITHKSLTIMVILTAFIHWNKALAQINFNFKTARSSAPVNYNGLGMAPDLAGANATNWNLMVISSSGQTTPIFLTNLVSSSGVVFTNVNYSFSNIVAGGIEKAWDDTAGGAPPNPTNLMRSYTYYATYQVTVSGLAPGSYDFWYYGHGDQPNQQGTVVINTNNGIGTFTTGNTNLGRDLINGGLGVAYTNFTGLTVSNDGVFRFTANYLNGFQLQPSQPEGPAFIVTGGSGCSGVDVGLSSSVVTNTYMLYFDGIYSGPTLPGTGSALDFGVQNAPGTYTVVATNATTSTAGLMYGIATVYTPGVSIVTQPSSVTVVSNLPASFSVQASGAALTYQWYLNGTALTNGGNLSGVTTSNLTITASQDADAATVLDGYTVVVQTPCGNIVTSSPPAALTLTAPRNLVWVGGNPSTDWNLTDTNFSLSGNPSTFDQGDDVLFNDSSSYPSVTISNSVVASSIVVGGTQGYSFTGPGVITGVSQLIDTNTGTLTIGNPNNDGLSYNNYTGGTTVGAGATLQLGDGVSLYKVGTVGGVINVSTGGTLNYNFLDNGGTVQLNNSLAGSGTVNVEDADGSIVASQSSGVSSNFNGTINVMGTAALHASDGNAGYALGNGATVNVASGTQAWLDRSSTAYNDTFNISGTGWLGVSPQTGALRIYGSTVNGPVNLLANARIGGTINGGTIQSVISGPYQMEVWGTAGSYVLNLGPTNGMPQGYGSTLITSGSINAMNTNAISTGPLTLDLAGDLRLNGNNLTVSNLSSINSGQVTSTTGSTIRNNNSKVAATLTVGTDGTSTEFDGTFLNGGAAPLGLTKVGAGVLTLTGVSTNTGAVTVLGGSILLSGSGSFGLASAIAVGPGGIFDVSARTDTTLTLSAVQTLEHAGGVAGPITVTGNVNLGGTLLLGVNHVGLTNDTLAVSGTVTYGGTLAVTNLGAALQAGDSFQLFPGATAGFAAFNLQTVDAANNTVYTWNNTVATDGKITVASVAPLVNTKSAPVTYLVSGGNLTLSWPPDHLGWYLQEQTNGLATGLTTNWVTVPTSDTVTQMTLPLGATNGAVFFRMVYTNVP